MRSLAFALVWLACVAGVCGGQPTTGKDAVLITDISPATFVDGVETEVTVTVAYELLSRDQAILQLAANSLIPHGFVGFVDQQVTKGAGTLTIKGSYTPRLWSASVPSKITAFLMAPVPNAKEQRPLAFDQKKMVVALRPRSAESTAAHPDPQGVFEDGIQIKSVSPNNLVEGQEVEISVVVSYELHSREEGEIKLTFSHPGHGGDVGIGSTRIRIGKGEVVIKGRITPMRTGTLPFTTFSAAVLEHPHSRRAVALAHDSETIAVAARTK